MRRYFLFLGYSTFLLFMLTSGIDVVYSYSSNKAVHTIPGVGCTPLFLGSVFVVITPDGTKAYVTNQTSNSVSVIDTSTDEIIHTISVGFKPSFMTITSDGAKVYVANQNSQSVSVISTNTDMVTDIISVGFRPYFVSITPDGAKAYVVNSFSNTVSVFDTSTDKVIKTIRVSDTPLFITITPDGAKAYVVNSFSNSISVIDTSIDKVIEIIQVGNKPYFLVITPDGTKAYVTNSGCNYLTGNENNSIITRGGHSNTISVIDISTDKVIKIIPVGNKPSFMQITPDGSKGYVINSFSNTVSVIDIHADKVIETISVGSRPFHIAITPDGCEAYVSNSGSGYVMKNGAGYLNNEEPNFNSVSVINTSLNIVKKTITVDSGPLFIAIKPDNSKAYVVNSFSNSVSVINIAKIDGSLEISSNKFNLIKNFNRKKN